jgi:hypothetical protein
VRNVPRSVAGGERLDAMRGADELRHDSEAAEHKHHVEHACADAAENKVAIAQAPAKAAPKTSAPIRMAALITVMTLSQTMRRS